MLGFLITNFAADLSRAAKNRDAAKIFPDCRYGESRRVAVCNIVAAQFKVTPFERV